MCNKIGLVLEGGGFRGLYSAGVLDVFIKEKIELPYVIGVSMGASNAASYISKQFGRNLKIPFKYVNDKRYLSYRRLLFKGELFGMDFIFNDIPNKLVSFDYLEFEKSDQEFVIVTTDSGTGLPYYISDFRDISPLDAIQASTSLPFASKMVVTGEAKLLDGGVVDPIPVNKALEDNCDKLVVVLTQPKEYRKSPSNIGQLGKCFYSKYPNLVKALEDRYKVYNEQVELVDRLESEKKAFVIRPKEALPVKRIEKNTRNLKEAYDIGYCQAESMLNQIRIFLQS